MTTSTSLGEMVVARAETRRGSAGEEERRSVRLAVLIPPARTARASSRMRSSGTTSSTWMPKASADADAARTVPEPSTTRALSSIAAKTSGTPSGTAVELRASTRARARIAPMIRRVIDAPRTTPMTRASSASCDEFMAPA
ncbi:hypothetical protein QE374_002715 [Microbacterium sp. SORGH_AS428]|uniref:hypothetical protein n=1 Tax=Microbacterium sp. SORGH_AS_0428 TaxID=3041788 RepID=UPI0028606025|nr:hypothetical protein [Microbacterium sp. SORGH_AS_0428]MDR6200806.1 hypothetical protein [Microbacterium sp. SORGH_AS_0428]